MRYESIELRGIPPRAPHRSGRLKIFYPGGGSEWAFNPERFRAVVHRPTDIEVFRKMLGAGFEL
jgi:hypothetical protein